MKPPRAPMTARVAMRLKVMNILKEHQMSGDPISNCEVARRAGCSENLVRDVKVKYMSKLVPGKLFIPVDQPRGGRPVTFSTRYTSPLFFASCLLLTVGTRETQSNWGRNTLFGHAVKLPMSCMPGKLQQLKPEPYQETLSRYSPPLILGC